MIPMEPGPEDFARMLSEQRARMDEARAIARYAHSRTGLLTRYLRRLADRIDPTGASRREIR
ncbi:MAG: hypothetical protein E6I27_13440 [Chloroflexi bacterium]|nr:MAG: hypothetical protein E6I96_13940 [Chloroflexota bacterium]TMF36399.1 MAG: hypothetical protein E6I27_13440 [Chloroflexota bacterium]